MFRHPDTVYAVLEAERQLLLAEAARYRLVAVLPVERAFPAVGGLARRLAVRAAARLGAIGVGPAAGGAGTDAVRVPTLDPAAGARPRP